MKRAFVIFLCCAIFPLAAFTQDSLSFRALADKAYAGDSCGPQALLAAFFFSSEGMDQAKARAFYDRLETKISWLREQRAFQKKEVQKITFVYDEIHKDFLNKYEFQAYFPQLCSSGIYNCVTASALYGYVFERLGIPYSVVEEPSHVYLVAYPETGRINIETTTPQQGFMVYTDEFKRKYVQDLHANKLISKEEMMSKSVEALFNDHYFKEQEVLNFRQLLGLQYSNLALYYNDLKLHEEAFQAAGKARHYFPGTRNGFLFTSLGTALLLERGYKEPSKDILILLQLANAPQEESIRSALIEEFGRFTHLVLIDRGSLEQYDAAAKLYLAGLTNDEIKKEAEKTFYYESARVLLNKGNFKASLAYADKALGCNPTNVDFQELLSQNLINLLRRESNMERIIDTLLVYKKKHAVLDSSAKFSNLLGAAYLQLSDDLFARGDLKLGEKYRGTFEGLIPPGSAHNLDVQLLSQYYSRVCFAYFRAGKNQLAAKALQTGLLYNPADPDLSRRLRDIR